MDEAVIKRIPPHSVEAERAVIGSMIMDKDAILASSEILTAEEFYQGQYGELFQDVGSAVHAGESGGQCAGDHVQISDPD